MATHLEQQKLLTCPYNVSHRIRPEKMIFHICKCRVNSSNKAKMLICPFNSTHHVSNAEMSEHVKSCPDRGQLDNFRYVPENVTPSLPQISGPGPSNNTFDAEEDWSTSSNQPYSPRQYLEQNAGKICIVKKGLTPSERRAFREQQRQEFCRNNDPN